MPNDTEPPNPSSRRSSESDIRRLEQSLADLETRVAALERGSAQRGTALHGDGQRSTESRFGLTAINRIGAVTLAAGIVFFFKYAADNEWIRGGGLVSAGMLAGLMLIAFGEWLRSRRDVIFAQGLTGCGLAILYITVYAAFAYYKLISREAGVAGFVCVSMAALALALRFSSAAIAAVGFIAAFVTPLLARIGGSHPSASWSFAYLLVVSAVSVLLIGRLYRLSPQIAVLLLAPFTACWAIETAYRLINDSGEFIAFVLVVGAAYFTGAAAMRHLPRLFSYLYVCGHACVIGAGVRAIDVWSVGVAPAIRTSFESAADSVALGVYGLFTITYGVWRRSAVDRLTGLVLLGLVIAKLYLYDVWLLARIYRITAFVALGILLLSASFLYSHFRQRDERS